MLVAGLAYPGLHLETLPILEPGLSRQWAVVEKSFARPPIIISTIDPTAEATSSLVIAAAASKLAVPTTSAAEMLRCPAPIQRHPESIDPRPNRSTSRRRRTKWVAYRGRHFSHLWPMSRPLLAAQFLVDQGHQPHRLVLAAERDHALGHAHEGQHLDFRVILPPIIEAAHPSHQHECP